MLPLFRRMPAMFVCLIVTWTAPRAEATTGVDVVATGGVQQAVMSANGRHVAWVGSGGNELLVKDRDSRVTRTFTAASLHPPAYPFGAGVQRLFALSDDGRYIAYQVGYQGLYAYEIRARADLSTGEVRFLDGWSIGSQALPLKPRPLNAPGVAMSRDGRTLAWYETPFDSAGQPTATLVAFLPALGAAFRLGGSCVIQGSLYFELCATTPAVSGDGRWILSTAGSAAPEALAYYDASTAQLLPIAGLQIARTYYPEVQPRNTSWSDAVPPIVTTLDGRFAVTRLITASTGDAVLFERDVRRVDPVAAGRPRYVPRAVSDDGEVVLLDRTSADVPEAILDRRSGLVIPVPDQTLLALSADGGEVLGLTATDLRVTRLDGDNDGILDGWERQFGLDPTDAADAGADPDGDGLTNAVEFASRSHPTALASATRLFAEGAAGSFFDTLVSVFNPGAVAAEVVVRFVGPAGTAGSQVAHLEPGARTDIASCCLGMLAATEFGVVIESTQPVVSDRRMIWDRVSGYGSHASTGVDGAASEWYFAEGATIGGLQTFFLIQNPGAADATASIEFLLTNGTSAMRSYAVPAGSRRTIWANQEGAPMAAAEFAAVVRASAPVVVERAMYRDRPGQVFAAGTNAIGATTPAMRWMFAEGSTGPLFDTFVLAANPGEAPVQVQARFDVVTRVGQRETVRRTYDVAPKSRLTLWLDELDALLADGDVVTTLEATGPIVAERAMWWPGASATWAEGHVEFGATAGGRRFAIADVETDDATQTETFILVGAADPDGPLPQLRVTAHAPNRTPIVREIAALAGRTTVWLRQTFPELTGRFSVVVESVGDAGGVPVVVERALYSHGFAAGAAARATPLPD
ncbi:hypothetical protein [Luteitalea sp.]